MLIGGVFLVGLAVTAPAEGRHHRGGNHLERLQSKLGLSEDQVAKLRPTFEQMKQRHQAQREAFKAHFKSVLTPEQLAKFEENKEVGRRGAMRDLGLSDDQKAQLKSFWESHRGQMQQERQQIDAQLQATLTPEQLTKYQEMKSRWGKNRRGPRSEEK